MTSYGSLAISLWVSFTVWLATCSFRLELYRQGAEADGTLLDLFELQFQDDPGLLCCHAWTRVL